MKDHFGIVNQARDAVIRGQPVDGEGPLIWLAQHSYEGEVPGEWKQSVAEMQAAARAAGDPGNATAQGRAVARIAVACGKCHQRAARGPRFAPQGFEEPLDPADREDVRGRMHRHLWSAERLWEGLIGPDQASWRVGAQVLAEAQPPAGAAARVKAGVEAVRKLGERALQASGQDTRAQVYGELLSRCARCHRALGIRP